MGFILQIYCDWCSSTAPGAAGIKEDAETAAILYGWAILPLQNGKEQHKCRDCQLKEQRAARKNAT